MSRGRKIATFTVTVYDDDLPPDCNSSTYDSSFDQVRGALVDTIANLQGVLDAPHECPFSPELPDDPEYRINPEVH